MLAICQNDPVGTPHYTGPNRSADRPHRAYIVNFANAAKLEQALANRHTSRPDRVGELQ